MTNYQKFIHCSKYSRWVEDKGRRETWEETVDRYIDFFKEHISENYPKALDACSKQWDKVRESIVNLEVVPSMRALKTAGKALKSHNVSGYNCAFVAVDHPHVFDEILYISCCGTGVGFSVEQKHVSKLPEIQSELYPTDTIVNVPDSKIGWATALREIISLLYAGKIPKYDTSKVRPYGAILKTFGGRASGPEPLESLFQFVIKTFQKAAGRKLSSLECHDIICKIGLIAESGGTRRAALISLSDLDDSEMRHAKSGNWWDANNQRSYANNSAAYYSKPELGKFIEEWLSLYRSHSGERGIFNVSGLKNLHDKDDRRDWSKIQGMNPSMPAGILVMNSEGIFPIEHLENKEFFVKTLNGELAPAKCFLSSKNENIYKINFGSGRYTKCTKEHKWPVLRNKKITRVPTFELKVGDFIPLNPLGNSNITGNQKWTNEEGFLLGMILGDGWIHVRTKNKKSGKYSAGIVFNKKEKELQYKTQYILNSLKENISNLKNRKKCIEIQFSDELFISRLISEFGYQPKKLGIPLSVWESNDSFIKGFIDGLYSADGSVYLKGNSINLVTSKKMIAEDVCKLLSFFGLKPRIKYRKLKNVKFPNGKNYHKTYDNYVVIVSGVQAKRFSEIFSFSQIKKQKKMEQIKKYIPLKNKRGYDYCQVKSITFDSIGPVWDISVDHDQHVFPSQYCFTGNCGEILLRNAQYCNLSEVVVRPDDTLKSLKEKVQIATFIGTIQSTLTKFKYIRKIWQKNCEEERLLGVSLTGILDNPILYEEDSGENLLKNLRKIAIEENKYWAEKLGINESTAITTVKPSGNTSQLCDTASGIHPRHSQYYIRTVRMDKKDPLTKFMIDQGVPSEDCLNKPQNTTIFSFPMKSPKNSIFRNDFNALQQLELWKRVKQNWAEHNVSQTIYVKDNEWLDVASWIYKNFEHVGGLSFLPFDGGSYKQAPYQECTKEEYEEFLKQMPKEIDWSKLSDYEKEDFTTSSKELACSSQSCDLI